MSTRDLEERKKRFKQMLNKNWEDLSKPKEDNDRRKNMQDVYWSYTFDKDESAYVTLRLLPDAEGSVATEDVWYFWTNPVNNRKYNAKCRDCLGLRDDPMTIYKNSLWNQDNVNRQKGIMTSFGPDSGIKKTIRYATNVYIINDNTNPENNGKVFLWNMPKSLYDMVLMKSGTVNNASMFGEDDEVPSEKINPFDPFEGGANLLLQVHRKKNTGSRNNIDYSLTKFGKRKPLFDDEEQIIELIDTKTHLLSEINSEKNIPSVDNLTRKLDYALGRKSAPTAPVSAPSQKFDDTPVVPSVPQNTIPAEAYKPAPNAVPDTSMDAPFFEESEFDKVQQNIDNFNSELDKVTTQVVESKPFEFDVDDDEFDPEFIMSQLKKGKE